MAPTDQEFNQLRKRVADLEGIHAGERLKNIRADVDVSAADVLVIKSDLDHAHAAFLDLRALVDELVMRNGALEARVVSLEASNPTVSAA